MIDVKQVYISFQQARGRYMSRPYRVPKNWDSIWSKIPLKNVEILELITKAFCTRWQNIDPDTYFDCGFRLFGKSFSYNKFYERKILLLYIENDKQRKRKDDNIKDAYEQSDFFVKEWMETKQYRKDVNLYRQYGMMLQDGMKAPIKHYLLNKISHHFITWLIGRQYLVLEDYEKNLLPLIVENYRKYFLEVSEVVDK